MMHCGWNMVGMLAVCFFVRPHHLKFVCVTRNTFKTPQSYSCAGAVFWPSFRKESQLCNCFSDVVFHSASSEKGDSIPKFAGRRSFSSSVGLYLSTPDCWKPTQFEIIHLSLTSAVCWKWTCPACATEPITFQKWVQKHCVSYDFK